MTTLVAPGIFEGVTYSLSDVEGITSIILFPNQESFFAQQGADLSILHDIGDEDPELVLQRFFASIPQRKGEPEHVGID